MTTPYEIAVTTTGFASEAYTRSGRGPPQSRRSLSCPELSRRRASRKAPAAARLQRYPREGGWRARPELNRRPPA